VRATVFDASDYKYHVIVPEECVADRAQISRKANLFEMHMKYADGVPLADVISYVPKAGCDRTVGRPMGRG
jgi:nicotinamidase-related amidase